MIGSKSSSTNSPNGEVSNIGSGDDLEMVHRATKVGKIVVDDNSSIQRERSTKSKRMEMIASKIDNREFFFHQFLSSTISSTGHTTNWHKIDVLMPLSAYDV